MIKLLIKYINGNRAKKGMEVNGVSESKKNSVTINILIDFFWEQWHYLIIIY